MSTHPNAILKLTLTPDDLSRRTLRAIMELPGAEQDDDDPQITVGGNEYRVMVMEGNWDENFQIGAKVGDIVIFDMVTYGYGEEITWDELLRRKAALDQWVEDYGETLKIGAHSFSVTANYW